MTAALELRRERTLPLFKPSAERMERLGEWFRAEYPRLLRFAYFVGGSREAAEDLVQDAFIKLYRAGARLDDEAAIAYARKTILNLSRTGFRRRGRERSALAGMAGDARVPDPADTMPRDEMWAALQTLSPQQRACVGLRFYEDQSIEQTASALGISVGAVKQQTSRAMEKLRALLGERGES